MKISAQLLTKKAFTPFGDVIEKAGAEQRIINGGRCIRFHDLAQVETLGPGAHCLINIFSPQATLMPVSIGLVERHPLGSQVFLPLGPDPFLVVVCEDDQGTPVRPRAFVTDGQQGVNYRANTWHAPLIAMAPDTSFAVIDRGGEGENLEEYVLAPPILVELPV